MSANPTTVRARSCDSMRRVWPGVIAATLAGAAFMAFAAAPGADKVLVVNSDNSIHRYSEVQTAFNASLPAPAATVDVTKEAPNENALKRVLEREKPDILLCIGAKAYQMTARVAKDTPIILSSAINWERFPPRKQRHVIANELPATTQLTLFRQFFPKVQRVGVLYSRDINRQWFEQAQAAAREIGVEIIGLTVRRSSDVGSALRELGPKVDALWLTPDPVVLETEAAVRQFFDRAQAARKPVFAYSPAFAELGATLILAPDMPTIGRQAAGLVSDLASHSGPVQTPAGSEVFLNLERVKACNLELNRDALDSVNHLIK